MTEIKIIPIFNQAAPGVWHDFAQVCAQTMYTNYNRQSHSSDIADWVAKDANDWQKRRAKFAFGAYDGGKMVGFIQGYVKSRQAWVDSLYLLRPYQGTGVGKRLLRAAEDAVSHIATHIELISLGGAMRFYESQGYASYTARNHYKKDLRGPARCAFLPVFQVSASLARQCYSINPDFSPAMVNVHHMPMFAHFDVNACMSGYIGATESSVAAPRMRTDGSAVVRATLQQSFDRYHSGR